MCSSDLRENEGDFIIAAEKITPEKVNFMMRYGRGVLCAPIIEERCQELELEMQVPVNTSVHETPFTVTVDRVGFMTISAPNFFANSRRWSLISRTTNFAGLRSFRHPIMPNPRHPTPESTTKSSFPT